MSQFKSVWFWTSYTNLTDSVYHVMSFYSDLHDKPSFVDSGASPDHSTCHSFNTVDKDGHQVIHLMSDDFNGSIPLWYVDIQMVESIPPCRMIIAFADDRYPNGTVIPYAEAVEKDINPKDSAGFVRWFIDDSRIQQIFVDESYRRKRISVKLFSIADIVIVSDANWNKKFLNGGDITTSDGELLRSAWSQSSRVTPRIGSVTH